VDVVIFDRERDRSSVDPNDIAEKVAAHALRKAFERLALLDAGTLVDDEHRLHG
jgi:hypothetical protein